MDDPVVRVLAINAFKRWCEWDWSRIVEEQPEKTVQAQTEILFGPIFDPFRAPKCISICIQCVKQIAKLILNKNSQTAAAALDFFQRVILEVEESRPMLGKLLQGCNQYDNRIIEAVDITSVRESPHENVRKAFFVLLRLVFRMILNHDWPIMISQ